MDASLLKFALICLMVVLGFGALFIVVFPFLLLSSMIGGAASTIAASKSSDDGK